MTHNHKLLEKYHGAKVKVSKNVKNPHFPAQMDLSERIFAYQPTKCTCVPLMGTFFTFEPLIV